MRQCGWRSTWRDCRDHFPGQTRQQSRRSLKFGTATNKMRSWHSLSAAVHQTGRRPGTRGKTATGAGPHPHKHANASHTCICPLLRLPGDLANLAEPGVGQSWRQNAWQAQSREMSKRHRRRSGDGGVQTYGHLCMKRGRPINRQGVPCAAAMIGCRAIHVGLRNLKTEVAQIATGRAQAETTWPQGPHAFSKTRKASRAARKGQGRKRRGRQNAPCEVIPQSARV